MNKLPAFRTRDAHTVLTTRPLPICEPGAKLKSAPVANQCPLTGTTSAWVEFKDHCYAFDPTMYNSSVYSMPDALGVCGSLGENVPLDLAFVYFQCVRDAVDQCFC